MRPRARRRAAEHVERPASGTGVRSDAPCEEDQNDRNGRHGPTWRKAENGGSGRAGEHASNPGGEVRHCRATTVIVMATRRRCVVPRVTVRPEDRVISLRDGRSMGFADYGPADGFVVVNAHGGLSCRLDIRAAAPVAEAAGIRLISPDRPGIGLSDPSPGRTVLDWASDVEQLADRSRREDGRARVVHGRAVCGPLGYALSSASVGLRSWRAHCR